MNAIGPAGFSGMPSKLLKNAEHVFASPAPAPPWRGQGSEATPAHPNRGRRSNLILFSKGEIASLPEPALSTAKGSLAMTL